MGFFSTLRSFLPKPRQPKLFDPQPKELLSNPPKYNIPDANAPSPTPIPDYGRSAKTKQIQQLYPKRYSEAKAVIAKQNLPRVQADLSMDVAAHENTLLPTGGTGIPGNTSRGMYMFNNPTWGDYLKASPSAQLAGHTQENPDQAMQAFTFFLSPQGRKRGMSLSRWNASKDKWGGHYTKEELAPYY